MAFLRRRVVTAALTSNALRPLPGFHPGGLSFVPGWLAGELAPHLLAFTAADTAYSLVRRRASGPGLAVAAATAGGLAYLIQQSLRTGQILQDALDWGLGEVAELDPPELAIPWRTLINPFDHRDARVRVDRDVVFTEAGRRGMLDIYRPAGRDVTAAPVLLQVHGGGWVLGRKDLQGVPLMQHMAAKGWVVVAINYRLAPRNAFPAQIIDVKKAIAWIRKHIEEYGGDPDYLAITGGSAGGHLASLAALTPGDPAFQPGFEDADTRVQTAVPYYGVYDLCGVTGLRNVELMRDLFLAPRVMQLPWTDHRDKFEAASPIMRITGDAPDFFVIHGTHDTMVSVDQARIFVERLRAVSENTVVYAELPGAQHAFDVFPSLRSAKVVSAVDRYLSWHHRRSCRSPARAESEAR